MNNLDNHIIVNAIPHPFSVERIDYTLPLGLSVQNIVDHVQLDPILKRHVHVFINGDYIPRENWACVRPKSEAIISLRMVPQGGGGEKNPLRTILSVALLVAAPQLSGLMSAQLGGAFSLSLTQNLMTGGLNFVGRLALNAIAPPSKSRIEAQKKESRTQFIQGARNTIEPFSNIPQVLGEHRMVPPLAARPYTETIGNDQYVRMLFVWGFGPLEISDLKIGETPLEEFDDVEIETRFGGEDDAELSLYSNVVLQNDLQVTLTENGGYETRTTDTDIDEISVDVTFPQGLVKFEDDGRKSVRTVQVEVQYAPAGTSDWTAGVTGYKAIAAQSLSNIKTAGDYKYLNGGVSHNLYKRIDSIVIDRANGSASCILGEAILGFNASGDPRNATIESPKAPIVPQSKIEIARVTQLGNIIGFEIVDRRTESDIENCFETSGDFEASVNGSNIDVTSGGLIFSGFEVRAKKNSAFRKSLRFPVTRGQYDVRLRRLTPDTNDDSIFDAVIWSALRGIRFQNPINIDGLAVTALRIKATDQLNGTIDQFNGVVKSIAMDWDGATWVEQATSNPASLFRHVLQGAGNARPLTGDRIDLDKLTEWSERCDTQNREFNGVVGSGQSVMDVLNDIAAAGRASPNLIDGRWGVVEDLEQSVPVQHFTPRNSFDFEGQRAFEDSPHGLRVKFNNREKGWQLDERIVYDDGYNASSATEFEGLELIGVTHPDQIWRDGRYHIASARLRSQIYSFRCDIEHIVCTRGDLVRLTHDVAMAGIAAARIKAITSDGGSPDMITGLTLDEELILETGKDYALRVRGQDGGSSVLSLINTATTSTSVTLQTPIENDATINVGDLCVFGEQGLESIELIVRSIEPQDNLTAKITCVDAAPEIHQADTASVPSFYSQTAPAPELIRPLPPILKNIQSGIEVLEINTDGSFAPRIVVSFEPYNEGQAYILKARIRAKDENIYQAANITKLDDFKYALRDVEEGEFYDLEFTYIRQDGLVSMPLVFSSYEVEGARGIPSDVIDFTINIIGEVAHLSWSPVSDVDLSHYVLKFTPNIGGAVVWENTLDLVPVVPKTAVSTTVPAMDGTYLIKAVDLGGRLSKSATLIQSTAASVLSRNIIETLTESPSFLGVIESTIVVNDELRLDGLESLDDYTNIDEVENIDVSTTGYATSGFYYFEEAFDLGAIYTSRICPNIIARGLDLHNTLDDYASIDLIEDFDNALNPEKWGTHLELRTTDDDPNGGSVTWSAWKKVIVGDYTARAFEFRLVLSSMQSGIMPVVSNLSTNIDMPDRIAANQDIISDVAGSTVTFDNAFRAKPALAISAQNMQTGDYYTLSSIGAGGFTIQFFDSSDTAISKSFDYLAKGYGQQSA